MKKMRTRTNARALFSTLLLLVALGAACKKPAPQAPAPTLPPPAEPPARPMVNLQASPTSIQRGQSTKLTWSSTNATSLTLSPEIGAVTAEGTQPLSPPAAVTSQITAPVPGGQAAATVRVSVTAPPPPSPAVDG